jgi:hypothetical protein
VSASRPEVRSAGSFLTGRSPTGAGGSRRSSCATDHWPRPSGFKRHQQRRDRPSPVTRSGQSRCRDEGGSRPAHRQTCAPRAGGVRRPQTSRRTPPFSCDGPARPWGGAQVRGPHAEMAAGPPDAGPGACPFDGPATRPAARAPQAIRPASFDRGARPGRDLTRWVRRSSAAPGRRGPGGRLPGREAARPSAPVGASDILGVIVPRGENRGLAFDRLQIISGRFRPLRLR